jgi:hypothetical protein
MNKDEKVQVRLQAGAAQLICWVDKHVKVGQSVTLKDYPVDGLLWDVLAVSEPKKASEIKSNRSYNVGGLTSHT